MKKFIFSLITLFFLIACNSNQTKTEVELGTNNESDISESCYCDSLKKNLENRLELNHKLYSGSCFSNYPNSKQKYIEKQIFEGKYHGKITYYDKNGKKLYSETYNKGESLGDLEHQPNCNCNDIKLKDENGIKKYYYKDVLYTGKCSDYYPNTNQVYLESNYQNGLLHGFTIYYQKDGKVLMIHDYENGKIIKEINPKK